MNATMQRIWYSRPWQWVMWRWVEFYVGYWWPLRLRIFRGLSQEEADEEVYLALRGAIWKGDYHGQPLFTSRASSREGGDEG